MVVTKHILIDMELDKFIKDNKKYIREIPNDVLKRLLKIKLKGGKNE